MDSLPKDILDTVEYVISKFPPSKTVFDRLVQYYNEIQQSPNASIKRPIEIDLPPSYSKLSDLSFINPIRKKTTLNFHQTALSVGSDDSSQNALLLSDIKYFFCLPTPNKVRDHYTITLFNSKNSYYASSDTIAFGFDDKAPNTKDFILNQILSIPALKSKSVYQPCPNILKSAASKEKKPVFHVDAYLKNKDGYFQITSTEFRFLYFLNHGIFYGFKKPLIFLPKDEILSMSIKSVTGRTFALVLEMKLNNESFDFEMIDSAQYQVISLYMKNIGVDGPSIEGDEDDADLQPQTILDTIQSEDSQDDEDFNADDDSSSDNDANSSSSESDDDNDNDDNSQESNESGSDADSTISQQKSAKISDISESDDSGDDSSDQKLIVNNRNDSKNTKRKREETEKVKNTANVKPDIEMPPRVTGMSLTIAQVKKQMKEKKQGYFQSRTETKVKVQKSLIKDEEYAVKIPMQVEEDTMIILDTDDETDELE